MIEFNKFDNMNIFHLSSGKEFLADKDLLDKTQPMISNVLLAEEDAFLINMNGEIIGAIDFNVYNKSCYVSYCILKSKRGNKFAPLILEYVKFYVSLHYSEATDISLRIELDNEKSINAALNAGYNSIESNNKKYLNYAFDLKRSIKNK